MKLSVITINYNNKAGLSKTVESVIDKIFRDCLLISRREAALIKQQL